jgi:hypothetical protein
MDEYTANVIKVYEFRDTFIYFILLLLFLFFFFLFLNTI